ncbi:MAG TPA: hypothetical protein VJP76_04595 [Candidatus Tumulicola sp.]|nr:hypothetical protein [Candidatus Tumulicola sp.]
MQSAIYLATAVDAPPVPLHAIRARVRDAAPCVRRRPPLTIVTAMVLIGVLALVVIDRAFVASPPPAGSRAPSPSPTIT